MINLIIALVLILFSVIYLVSLFRRNVKETRKNNLNSWDLSMILRGVLGGVSLLILGILIFIKNQLIKLIIINTAANTIK